MLAMSDRVSPCRARCSPRSVGRLTRSCPSSWSTVMSRLLRSDSAPRGPVTWTTSGSIVTVTPSGTGMGFLPMRLTTRSPHLGDDLAAHAGAPRLVAGHDAARRRDDRGAHAALDLADPARGRVVALARARDPAQAADRRAAVLGVLQRDADELARVVLVGLDEVEAQDVALLAQDARHLPLEVGRRDVHLLVGGDDPVADTGQEVGYRIGLRHTERVLPGRLGHPGDEAVVGQLAQADPAEAELAIHGAGPSAATAASVLTGRVLGRARLAHPLRGLGHVSTSSPRA